MAIDRDKASPEERFDAMLKDFPRSEIWRLQTDGWQQVEGPSNFRDEFYQGMQAGFTYLRSHWRDPLSVELIEGLYHSAYQFEDSYRKDKVLQSGIRNEENVDFQIYFPEAGVENTAGVSEEGLKEFIINFIEARQDKSKSGSYRWYISFTQGSAPFTLELDDEYRDKNFTNNKVFADAGEVYTFLKQHLKNAALSKQDAVDFKNYHDKPTSICISCKYTFDAKDIKRFIRKAFKTYIKEIQKISDQESYKLMDFIPAMVKLVRSLHQTHPFLDGNGRTLIFLLSNLLLMQQGMSMRMIDTPAHFAGYSVAQLTAETKAGLKEFEEYKVTNAVDYLKRLSKNSFDDIAKTSKELDASLSSNPMIKLAQLNELFLQVSQKQLKIKSSDTKIQGFFDDRMVRKAILSLLKQKYYETFLQLVKLAKENKADIKIDAILDWIMKKHEILKDTTYPYIQSQKKEVNLKSAIVKELEPYAAKKQQPKFR